MARDRRAHLPYLFAAAAVAALGLASRRHGAHLPAFVAEYAGDALWALGVFLGIGALSPRSRASRRGALALAFAYAVELSQLYHAPWIDAVRSTRLGGLVLGFGFLWTDLVCYAAGVACGLAIERIVRSAGRDDGPRASRGPGV